VVNSASFYRVKNIFQNVIDTVLIPAAGLGTRLFTLTKESPKEMVPVFYRVANGNILVKPLLEIIFENIFDAGFRNFIIIVGRGKEMIENHLSPHYGFIDLLKKKEEYEYANILLSLYKKIEKSSIVWIRQHRQRGIGPATLLAEKIVGDRPFLFHAGDLYIPQSNYLKQMLEIHRKMESTATIGIKKVSDPRQYGVATLEKSSNGSYRVIRVVEKPKHPPSNFALTGVNVFEPEIFSAIKSTKKGINKEIQLTDSIQTLLNRNHDVFASMMKNDDVCIDIGTPKNYFAALSYSFKHAYLRNSSNH